MDAQLRKETVTMEQVTAHGASQAVVEGEGLPTETFSLKYAAVQWEYVQQTMDGKTAKGAPAMWSLATNKPVFEAPN